MKLDEILTPAPWLVLQPGMSPLWALFIVVSAIWLSVRAIKVFQKPTPEIEELLGHDIPPQPEVALSSVTANSVTLYWKPPENYHTQLTNFISVNGIRVAQIDTSDTPITIDHLIPGKHYLFRAITTNLSGHTSYSRVLQVQTTPAEGHRASKLLSITEQTPGKRPSTSGRRVSHPTGENEKDGAKGGEAVADDASDEEGSLSQLTKRLDLLREEKEELEQQLSEEVEEVDRLRGTLTEEREKLRKQFEDKDKALNESRKQLNDLEKSSKAAQRKKSAKERDLQKKKSERQKMKEEIAQWASERETLKQATEKLRNDRISEEDKQESREAEAQQAIDQAQASAKALEEEIREWGTKVKALEEERKLAGERQEEEEQEADRAEREEENLVQQRIQELEIKYQNFLAPYNAVIGQLQQLRNLKHAEPWRFAVPNEYGYNAYAVPRSQRNSVSQIGTGSFQPTTYATAAPQLARVQGPSPPIATAIPTFSSFDRYSNSNRSNMTEAEIEALTGGAGMSPGANMLLPSGLLRDDPESMVRTPSSLRHGDPETILRHHGSGVHDDLDSTFRARKTEPTSILDALLPLDSSRNQDPQSPSSQHSLAPSFLASPQEAHTGLASDSNGILAASQDLQGPLNLLSDSASRKGSWLSWNNRRGTQKGPLREGPLLGTLRQGESQSFPIGDDDEEDAGPTHGHRKMPSNPFANMGSVFSRHTATAEDLPLGSASPIPRKSRLFGGGKKADPKEAFYALDRRTSPRPASTYSYDPGLLRPSSDNQPFPPFASESSSHLPTRFRASPLATGGAGSGADWSSLREGMGAYGSATQSRRQSIQHGSTGNLSLGSSALRDGWDDYEATRGVGVTRVAPIGSGRPGRDRGALSGGLGPGQKKLNPAAQSFVMNMFGRGESSKRTTKAEKAGDRDRDRDKDRAAAGGSVPATPSDAGSGPRRSIDLLDSLSTADGASSPSLSRMSRDGHSVMTNTTDGHDSVGADSDFAERSTAGSSSSHQQAAAHTPSSSTGTPKESLMQRITRKSSSSKFTAPWSKDKRDKTSAMAVAGSSASRRKSSELPLTPSEADEDGSDYLGPTSASSTLGTPIEARFGFSMDDAASTPGDERSLATTAAALEKSLSKGTATAATKSLEPGATASAAAAALAAKPRGSLSSSWSKMMGAAAGKRGSKKESSSTAMSETSERSSRDEDES